MNVNTYAKAVTSAATGIVAWGTAAATLLALVPDKRVAGVVAGLLLVVHFVQTFLVWLTKNENVIEADITAAQKVIGFLSDWRGSVDELKILLHQILGTITSASGGAAPMSAEPSAERHV
ncbi:hypothetical protein [Nocardia africana]